MSRDFIQIFQKHYKYYKKLECLQKTKFPYHRGNPAHGPILPVHPGGLKPLADFSGRKETISNLLAAHTTRSL